MIVSKDQQLELAIKYLDGKELTCDEIEILLYALYLDSVVRTGTLMYSALVELVTVREPAEEAAKKANEEKQRAI
jgi:hypothetical protein